MKPQLLSPADWTLHRRQLLAFALKYGERRITSDALRWLARLDPALLAVGRGGAAAAIVRDSGRIVGFAAAAAYGKQACIVVTHPEARGRGIGGRLLGMLGERLGPLSCQVAADNLASIAMCLKSGMTAQELFKGPTGKPTFRFAGRPAAAAAKPRARR